MKLTALSSQLLQNAQESHGVAVPTPSVPEDFGEKAALGKRSSLLGPDDAEGSAVPCPRGGKGACTKLWSRQSDHEASMLKLS